ncbi:hypothetical protein SDC9_124620 [bioreactor metagenome]|uniref:Uncharacterized protein n=1 Tax=bioreactor metagenome TaxID=1076179 RepID=A0A645CL05_9ZZZZ
MKTTTVVWVVMAIIAFSFNLLAAEPQTVQQKSKVKSIAWVVVKDGEIYATCEYSSGKVKIEVI